MFTFPLLKLLLCTAVRFLYLKKKDVSVASKFLVDPDSRLNLVVVSSFERPLLGEALLYIIVLRCLTRVGTENAACRR